MKKNVEFYWCWVIFGTECKCYLLLYSSIFKPTRKWLYLLLKTIWISNWTFKKLVLHNEMSTLLNSHKYKMAQLLYFYFLCQLYLIVLYCTANLYLRLHMGSSFNFVFQYNKDSYNISLCFHFLYTTKLNHNSYYRYVCKESYV